MDKSDELDLDACALEPIRIPGAIQPHGALLALDAETLRIRQFSRNAREFVGDFVEVGGTIGGELATLREELQRWQSDEENSFERNVTPMARPLHAVAHRSNDCIILEFEAMPEGGDRSMDRLFPRIRSFAESVTASLDVKEMAHAAAQFVRGLTGYDRVLVYSFDGDWNGHVIGEDGNGNLPSYLDLRFPAGDIPAQARELYRLNRLRIIPDAAYEPCPIEPLADPENGEPLDLSFAMLRSVSPIHVEYMRNMGTASSMSISIVVEGQLWGLIACHNRNPHQVPLNVRNACDFAIQSLAAEIAARGRASRSARQLALGDIRARLLAAMAATRDWRDGLKSNKDGLLAQVDATGAVVIDEQGTIAAGVTPGPEAIEQIIAWLEKKTTGDLFVTDNLAARLPAAKAFADVASGLLAVRISELHPNWLLWFRPEIVRMVEWAGDPHKYVSEKGRIHPRVSFETWKQQVRSHSKAWQQEEIAAAHDLRGTIVGIVLRKAEELAQLSGDLQRSNKELEAFSYSVSHDLRAPFRHIVGFTQLLRERQSDLDGKSLHYLESISEAAVAAGRLVDDLLNFSQIGRAAINHRSVDMNKIAGEVRRSLDMGLGSRKVEWSMGQLPETAGDASLLRQVLYNLMENAVKYTRPRDVAEIGVSGWREDGKSFYRVEDNGVGFDMAYIEKIFGVFQRLQRAEDFEGTGIGLALVRRIVERHGGNIEAEGELEKGSQFTFWLPDVSGNARV